MASRSKASASTAESIMTTAAATAAARIPPGERLPGGPQQVRARTRGRRARQGGQQHHRRDVGQEDRTPPEVLQQDPAEDRPGRDAACHRPRPDADRATAPTLVVAEGAQEGEGRGHQGRPAHAERRRAAISAPGSPRTRPTRYGAHAGHVLRGAPQRCDDAVAVRSRGRRPAAGRRPRRCARSRRWRTG